MQAFLDFLPVIAFFAAYWITKDFQIAIVVIMIAMTIQVAATWLLTRTVNKMLLASWILLVVLGGISLFLQNDLIFKWKPTILNWLFAAVFMGSQYIGDKPLIQRVLGSVAQDEIQLSPGDWKQLNIMWVVFFIISGAANIIVAYSFDEETWVNFKLFGLLGMTFVFLFIQAYWISRKTLDHKLEADIE
ncbi:MAG: inner membrane-spanning protein YciB [Gammaproteobacteria bacterium]